MTHDNAEVKHLLRQSSDHALLVLDTNPQRTKTRARFIFDSKWTQLPKCEEMVKTEWDKPVQGSSMFRVKQKLKLCKNSLIKWRKTHNRNASMTIESIQQEMEVMQGQRGREGLGKMEIFSRIIG